MAGSSTTIEDKLGHTGTEPVVEISILASFEDLLETGEAGYASLKNSLYNTLESGLDTIRTRERTLRNIT